MNKTFEVLELFYKLLNYQMFKQLNKYTFYQHPSLKFKQVVA